MSKDLKSQSKARLETTTVPSRLLSKVFQHAFHIRIEVFDLYTTLFHIEDLTGHRPPTMTKAISSIGRHANELYKLTAAYDDLPEGYEFMDEEEWQEYEKATYECNQEETQP